MALLPMLSKGECFLRPLIMSGRELSPLERAGEHYITYYTVLTILSRRLPQKTIIHPREGRPACKGYFLYYLLIPLAGRQ
jgi:hypothetical protein